MTHNWNRIAQCSVIGAACSLAVWIGTTNANEESVLLNKPAATTVQSGPVLPPPSNPNQSSANANSNADVFAPQAAPETLPTPPQSRPQTKTTVKRPFMRPAEPRAPQKGRLVAGAESIPTPPGAAPIDQGPVVQGPVVEGSPVDINVRPTPPIEYDTDHDARKMYRSGKIDIVMLTKNPADGCAYEIPICIPACCEGDPQVSGGRGLLGRGVVEYRWACGFRAIVKFRQILGDVKVEYEGD